MDNKLPIEVTTEDETLLADIAKSQYREPHQQAAAFVHDALEAYRARQARGETGPATLRTPNVTRRGARQAA